MGNPQQILKGRAAWLLMPSTIITAPIGFATVYYCWATFDLPPGTLDLEVFSHFGFRALGHFFTCPLIVMVAVVASVLGTIANVRYSRRLRVLSEVATGKLPASVENLRRIAQDVHAMPDVIFKTIVQMWVCGVVGVVAVLHFWVPGFNASLMARMTACNLLLCPLGALASYLVVTRRARRVLGDLTQLGLSASDLLAVIPDRRQIRMRTVIFGAVLVFTPATITADVALTVLRRHIDVMLKVDPAHQAEAADQAVREAVKSVAYLATMVFVFGMLAAYLGGAAIAEPLTALAREATRIARGDLSALTLIQGEDEIWAVSRAFAQMQMHLTGILGQLQTAGIRISSATEQMMALSDKGQAGAHQQAASVHETTATTEELARVARQIAENAESVARTAQKTFAAAQSGQANSKAFIGSMAKMKDDNRAIADSVVALNQKVAQIGRIVEFINGIADKSDLLALNAELEGTKAGEVGRGFSLVAGEMRRLAENVMRSTREIEQLIEEIRQATSAAVAATEAGVRATDSGASLAHQVSENLEHILALAGETAQSAGAISQATQQQQSSSSQLADAMTSVLRVTDQTVSATKQMSSSSVDLGSLSKELKSAVDRFQVGS